MGKQKLYCMMKHDPCKFQKWEMTMCSQFFSNLRHKINLILFLNEETWEFLLLF